ncbi:MAG: hypothetical protein A3G59_01980 [Candidatus Taylorbacteria bacterium RIFCSPLOWO2_12_FULL_47_20]|uniref:Glutamate--tRNA ligase n=2 Tax=Candidatus Tayloriibacteriota TaxID=1817919 RepID=A0A1G2P723_9BACT|nr:MAG: hypothetical protein A3H68_02550 [Candidatus Taylorbacteria bacterium RIFCSPLOWO2_02_FULL_46_40]OHA44110.1 MAG: hypothetical protein A3G59_01980 [Candidatus Taylorbacteria bacterium RIFCSPLOWO2_12_FULL_47_20]
MDENEKVVVRFAPSSTGPFHVGGARTALFNYLFAKKSGGKFIVRIEDTDKQRSEKKYEEQILDSLKWLSIKWDDLYKQSDRSEIYEKYLKKLVADGFAYISKEEKKTEGSRDEVIRFKNPNKKIAFEDLIKGVITFDTTELGDFVIAKSLDEPLFHLAVVVDDYEMGITHVIRGEDHISNTPRQMLIQEAIGAKSPRYAHIPLILADDRSKLSKRKHGESVTVIHYRSLGFLPEAIVNFLAFLGWNPGSQKELYTLRELITDFDISQVQKNNAIFNMAKLRWFNREYLKLLPQDVVFASLRNAADTTPVKIDEGVLKRAQNTIMERINTYSDFGDQIKTGEWDWLFREPLPSRELLLWKKCPDAQMTAARIKMFQDMVGTLPPENFKAETISGIVMDAAIREGKGEMLWPVRAALSGKDKSPDPFTLCEILQKDTVNKRLDIARKILLLNND